MNTMSKYLKASILGALLFLVSFQVQAQFGPIRAEVSPGVYVNVSADSSGHLIVGTGGSGAARGPEGTAVGAKVALSNVSAQSGAVTGTFVDVSCDVDCFVLIAANPTAVADTSYKMIGYVTYRFPITTGNKIAGILSTGTGNLWWHAVQ